MSPNITEGRPCLLSAPPRSSWERLSPDPNFTETQSDQTWFPGIRETFYSGKPPTPGGGGGGDDDGEAQRSTETQPSLTSEPWGRQNTSLHQVNQAAFTGSERKKPAALTAKVTQANSQARSG